MEKYYVGDRFVVIGETYILAMLDDWKSSALWHYQLINLLSGNRLTSKVITHVQGVDNGLCLLQNELDYLLEGEVITKHQKGYLWE